jgi:hypothetical protein
LKPRSELVVKILLLAEGLGDTDTARKLITEQRHHLFAQLAELTDLRADSDGDRAAALVAEGAALHVEADLRWLDMCEQLIKGRGT